MGFCLSSSSYGKRLDDPTLTSASTGTSSAGLSRLNSVLAQRYFTFIPVFDLIFLTYPKDLIVTSYLFPEDFLRNRQKRRISLLPPSPTPRARLQASRRPSRGASESRLLSVCVDGKALVFVNCGPDGAALNLKVCDLCRSYLTPVRDEEAEAQRKARSRHARQSRRSTQVPARAVQILVYYLQKQCMSVWYIRRCYLLFTSRG